MKSVIYLAVAVISLLGVTTEAQQLPKSGKYTGKYASHLVGEARKFYELEKGHVFILGASNGVFLDYHRTSIHDRLEEI